MCRVGFGLGWLGFWGVGGLVGIGFRDRDRDCGAISVARAIWRSIRLCHAIWLALSRP